MFNCLILGSGRSGTSMTAGVLAKNGYYMGDDLIPPRAANPKGFFESSFININVNEAILKSVNPSIKKGWWWLTPLSLKAVPVSDYRIRKRIRMLVSKTPYCYKDPRFCYTLPLWYPYLKNTRLVCVFRHPYSTIRSTIKECDTANYLKKMIMTPEKAMNLWISMYLHVIRLSKKGDWLFLHYNQLFNSEKLKTLSKFLKVKIDPTFPEKNLQKPIPKFNISVPDLYRELCNRANYAA